MADSKITALTALTAADPVNDMFPIVDVSDTTMAASGTTKRISVNNILGASGTATLASATITGAATVGTTLGVTGVATFASSISAVNDATVSGSGRLTVGSASGNAGARVDLRGWSSANANWRISSALYGAGLDFTPSTTAGGTTFTTPAFAMLSSGDLSMVLGNVVMGTSGKGIDFSATAGTGTSELLNDYEEGTWTPVVTSTTGTLTSVTGQAGAYTKIGRIVTVTGFFQITTNGTGSGSLSVAGLPFTNGALSNTGAGRVDGTTGNMTQVKINATTAIALISKYDNAYPAADGADFPFTITYTTV